MAAPPVLPADFDATKINANDNNCAVLTKSTQLTINAAALIRWMFNDDGSFTQDFLDAIGTGSTGLAAPTGLNATDDRTTDITLTWASVSSATSYSVYRGTVEDSASMSLVASGISATTYVDTGVAVDTTFFYRVKASNASQISALSSAEAGKRTSSSSGSDPVSNTVGSGTGTVIVPAGKTTLELLMFGGGGSGGMKQTGVWVPIGSGAPPPGGGGSSGSFIRISSISVTAGDSYTYVVGGSDGETVFYKSDNGALIAKATAGNPGKNASFGAGAAGASPSTYGSNSLGSGSVDGVNSAVGNAGSGTTPGAALSYSGLSAGAGGAGTIGQNDRTPGSNGLIKYTFT